METVYIDKHADLVAECRTGSRKAQFEIYKLYAAAMYNVALRIVNDDAEAEDVLQEAFLDAFNRIADFRQETTFGLWLKQIVINRSINYLRKRKLETVSVDEVEVADEQDPDFEETQLKVEAIKSAMAELPDGYRVVLSLYLFEGLTQDGIIYTLDVNEELEDMVRENFAKSPLNSKIEYILGDAQQSLAQLNETFDLVFIDADKKNNGTYYDLVFDRVRSGGLMIVDNVLWSGKIVSNAQDKDTKNISSFNDKINEDQRVEKLILPVRDGLFVIRKK